MATLDKKRKLIIRAVIENTIDQLAIVGGTIQLALPTQGKFVTIRNWWLLDSIPKKFEIIGYDFFNLLIYPLNKSNA